MKKHYAIILMFLCFFSLYFLNDEKVYAADSPYDVSKTVKNDWKKTYGNKKYDMETGKTLVYDIYGSKFTKGGYKIITQDFGKGKKKYLNFQGWSILFGHKSHTATNHETYIALENTKTGVKKVYSTTSRDNLSATIDVAYNRYWGGGLYNPCGPNVTNVSNLTCNMKYEDVAFDAWIPLDELFPNINEADKWKMFIVKRVNSKLVYTELFVPFDFDSLKYGLGVIDMTSGVDATTLQLNSYPVIRRTSPRANQTGAVKGYFVNGKKYKSVKYDEKDTAIWFGVKSPHDGGATRWAASPYWNFGGDQAVIKYKPEVNPSISLILDPLACLNSELTPKIEIVTGKGKQETLSPSSSKITWKSSKPSVISIIGGKIKAIKVGTSTVTVYYKDPTTGETYKDSKKVKVADCGDPTEPGGFCKYVIDEPTVKDTMKKSTVANPNGSIAAEGVFDVSQGIPTSEELKTKGTSEKYVFDQVFQNKIGKVIYTVPVKKDYIFKWKEKVTGADGKETTESKTITMPLNTEVEIKRDYSYWDIGRIQFYQLNQIDLMNYVFDGEIDSLIFEEDIDLYANNVEPVKKHVYPAECNIVDLGSKTIDTGSTPPTEIPKEDLKGEVDKKIGKNKVKNDAVELDEEVIMDDEKVEEKTKKPKNIPDAEKATLENHNILISNSKVNYNQSPSQGASIYSRTESIESMDIEEEADKKSSSKSSIDTKQTTKSVDGEGDGSDDDLEDTEELEKYPEEREFEFDLNSVTIHTPIVLKGDSSDEVEYDQRIDRTPHKTKHVLILDRQFRVDLSATGSHRSIPGYGTRDYTKYIHYKEVKFPFDVYDSNKAIFYPAGTWIRLGATQTSANFFLPIWVPEDEYKIQYREFAINAPSEPGSEAIKNVTIPNGSFYISPAGNQSAAHMVTDEINVDVVGRVYDFRVTDVSDYNWEDVFRTGKGSEHTKNYFWVGTKNRDGLERGNNPAITLPILQGKHTDGYKNVAVKTGYHFKFDLKTMGNMFANNDAIRITPKFYFVDKNGQNRKEVDIYYHDSDGYFVQVGSNNDKTYRKVMLNTPLRNLTSDDLTPTADYYYRHADKFGLSEEVANTFYSTFIRNYVKKTTKKNTVTGPYGWQVLNWNLRNYIGPKSEMVPEKTMIPSKDTLRSEQQWYGEYSLPSKVYVVEKGKNVAGAGVMNRLNENHPMFLKKGYIIINFDIETIRDGKINDPYLHYVNGNVSNEWKREGFKYSYTDPYGGVFNLIDGDVLFYHADKSADDDFKSGVTH
ncbi:DUF5704 domain-containing protein [Viridibacillus arvi]|uniref:DUF5704 domain-containing protein n=1 Tax=Viridibacillus arvi TaxID=263475 RepID=UPI003D2D721B